MGIEPNKEKIVRYFTDSDYRFLVNTWLFRYYFWMDDEKYLKRKYKAKMGSELDLEHPRTLNEKLQWLKIHDRNPIYTTIVDKCEAKKYVASIIGDEFIIPTIGVWDRAEDIDFSALPNQFVLKCTHDSHGLIICKDKSSFDIKRARRFLASALSRDYYIRSREWPYKDVKHRIIGEKYIEDETGFLTDYKFYCFNGTVDCVLTCFDRETGDTKFYFFDRNWKLKRYNKMGKQAPEGFSKPKPKNVDKMFEIAETLGKASGAKFIRVDLYNVHGKIYFGELTLFPASGYDKGRLPETDILFGDMLKLGIE